MHTSYDAPKSADRFPNSSDGCSKSSEGFPIPVASTPRPPTPPSAHIRQNSGRKYVNKEVCMYIRMLKPLKTRKEKEELKCKHPGSTNCQNHSDVIVSDVIVTASIGDITTRDINKPIARKRYAPRKQSLVHSKGIIESSLRVCSRTFTRVACILAIVISILGGLCNIKLLKQKSPIGTSSSLTPSTPRDVLCFLDSSVLSILLESSATIVGINEGLCSCINKRMFLNDNKHIVRCAKVLQNMIMREERGYVYPGYATYALNVYEKRLHGKHLDIYIFLSAEFCTFRVDYLDIYIVNLDSGDNLTVLYNLIYMYIYIYNVYHSWASCSWATYPEAILVNICTLIYFSSKVIVLIIKSHDKYQSLILIGLAHAEMASSRNRSV